MNAQLQERLLAINREFYARFAQEFAGTRTVEHANLSAIMPYLRNGVKLLDIGCGSGRVAERLDREKLAVDYLGVDVTPSFVESARSRAARLARVRAEFQLLDITRQGWTESLSARAPFDVALAAAVLHHFPGFELRCAVLGAVRSLLRPGGILVLSNWQFQNDPRLLKKVIAWDRLDIDAGELEEGDTLIDWKRGGDGYRFCHLLTPAEVERAARQSGFAVLSQHTAERELNLWSILQSDLKPL
jgi:tRNA (uracil-5-)-methyltransferase TRM9